MLEQKGFRGKSSKTGTFVKVQFYCRQGEKKKKELAVTPEHHMLWVWDAEMKKKYHSPSYTWLYVVLCLKVCVNIWVIETRPILCWSESAQLWEKFIIKRLYKLHMQNYIILRPGMETDSNRLELKALRNIAPHLHIVDLQSINITLGKWIMTERPTQQTRKDLARYFCGRYK